ncbi:MAG: 3-dehydroquinate dehydratase [Nitratireductor sp.]|nr:3-dehydroquinate dehydratase [Nitratireductor sp.]MCC0020757.1 3-dehydroquinate dehydratase [Nitratireductor sp.]
MSGAIHILNGPNLNRLGTREPEIYGSVTLAQIEEKCRAASNREIVFRQSNYEGEIVGWIHDAIDAGASGIIINPAGLTFTSVPVYDALKMFPGSIIELHISNIHRREAVYHNSLVSKVATAIIAGLGPNGYLTAVSAMEDLVSNAGK